MRCPKAIPSLVLALLMALPLIGRAADQEVLKRLSPQENALNRVIESIREGRSDQALREVDQLIEQHPNFRLAHLIRGDLLMARAKRVTALGIAGRNPDDRMKELRAEAAARIRAYGEHPTGTAIPASLVQIPHRLKHVIAVDASRSRLYVFENRQAVPRLIAEFYVSVGRQGVDKTKEGDQRTPLGVYHITSRIPGEKLPDLYGWGAFPIDYPNEWDRRAGRTGYGIWLHGVPSDTFARAPLASDGCVALSNPDMARLAQLVEIGSTPVIIADRLNWEPPDAVERERRAFLRQLEAWRLDWESRDTKRYLAHYAGDFRSGGTDLRAWSVQKISVNRSKTWIKIGLSDISLFRSHEKAGLMVVTFDQDYRSSNLSQKTRKRQYWVRESGQWKIAYEGVVSGAAATLPESYRKARRT